MAIPKFDELFHSVLSLLASGNARKVSDLRETLASEYALTEDDLAERLPSGTAKTFVNRVAWAVFYLMKVLALERVDRGVYRITERGKDLLAKQDTITLATLANFDEYATLAAKSATDAEAGVRQGGPTTLIVATTATPEESMEAAAEQHKHAIASQLRDRILSASPDFFEQLVINVMVSMGYGGNHATASERLGKSGDGGIDGVIREDRLGLDVIYLQAKRWEANVGRPEIQKFVGALHGHHASRGVFITSSAFSKEARDYAETVSSSIVLIDGDQLAQLMIDHRVGVTVRHSFELFRVDLAYFGEGDLDL